MNKKIIILFAIIYISIFPIANQINAQILPPNASEEDKRASQDLLRRTGQLPDSNSPSRENILFNSGAYVTRGIIPTGAVYRNPDKKELIALSPNAEDLNTFADFLRQKNTGLVKLINGKGCLDRGLIDSNADCFQYSAPGNGATYSFRVPTYRVAELGDLTLEDGNFKCLGKYVQGIMTTIGNIPLENITLQTQGIKFLKEFKPEIGSKNIEEKNKQFAKGIESDSFIYRNGWQAIENTTFVLRSIAYKAGFFNNNHELFLDIDKRKDIIVAFRVVRKDDDGSITILWKELATKSSPGIKK